jgi:hypothetical protein
VNGAFKCPDCNAPIATADARCDNDYCRPLKVVDLYEVAAGDVDLRTLEDDRAYRQSKARR